MGVVDETKSGYAMGELAERQVVDAVAPLLKVTSFESLGPET